MKSATLKSRLALSLVPLTALAFVSISGQAQTSSAGAPAASMPQEHMQNGAPASNTMEHSMMNGMDSMQKMPMSGDTDKDFAMMMKMHHQKALEMAELELAKGKSPAMKKMATQIIAAQKREIAQFDQWLAKHQ